MGPAGTPYRIAVIGAGQLGSRHLQGLATVPLPCEIYVVDPTPASLDTARQRLREIAVNPAVGAVHFASAVERLPRELDYVVIATTADVRLAVLQALLAHSRVRAVLLEKVLFQREADYEASAALLRDNLVRAWVNCPRRAWPVYADLREFFSGDPVRSLTVTGGNWGLGCNSVHFLDLLGFLSDSTPAVTSASGLDESVIPSKRPGFIEFTGSLRGAFSDGATFDLTARRGSTARLLVMVRGESRAALMDETAGSAFLFDGSAWAQRDFKAPQLSRIAGALGAGILAGDPIPLASFEQSTTYHVPLVKVLAAHAAAATGTTSNVCPIT